MDTTGTGGKTWACPTTDEELRRDAQRRWRRGDRDEQTEDTLGNAYVKRQYVLDEIRKLSEPSKAARLRLRRMHTRIERLTTVVEEAKLEYADGTISGEVATARITRLCLDVIPTRRLVFWAACAATKTVREAYKKNAAKVSALWDEFWALGEPSVQDNREAMGERDANGMWGAETADGRFVRDSVGDWDE